MLVIINDIHIGAIRSAGTTIRSAFALRDDILNRFEQTLERIDGTLVILGDLFDTYAIPLPDLLRTYRVLRKWLDQSINSRLILVPGNHDLSKDSSRLSSLEFLANLLLNDPKVVYLNKPGYLPFVEEKIYAVPHLLNQDLFDLAIEQVPDDADFVLFHANFDNNFAVQSDHSLNVSREQAAALPGTLIFGHEHHARQEMNGKVIVIGNQFPTSVSDWLGPDKQLLVIDDKQISFQPLEREPLMRIDWRALSQFKGDAEFIRVEGFAAAAESAQVVDAIAKFRARSQAFVVSNAVLIEGVAGLDKLPDNLEEAKAFDVLGCILDVLDDKEREVIKGLLKEHQND